MCCGAPWPMESPRYRSWWRRNRRRPGDFHHAHAPGRWLPCWGCGQCGCNRKACCRLPAALPERDDSRLVVFSRDGTILSFRPTGCWAMCGTRQGCQRCMRSGCSKAQPLVGRGITQVMPDHIVSMAGMPLPQWVVAQVSYSRAFAGATAGRVRNAMHGDRGQCRLALAPRCWCCCWGGWPNPWPGCGWLHSNCWRATPGPVQWPRVRGEVVTWSGAGAGWRAGQPACRQQSAWAASFRRFWTTPRSGSSSRATACWRWWGGKPA